MEPKMYIVVNKLLKMGKGKIAGQVGHGVSMAVRSLERAKHDTAYDVWSRGHETKIVVQADQEIMEQLRRQYGSAFRLFSVFDAGKTQIDAGSFTVLVFQPLPENMIPNELKSLRLL